MTALQFLRRTVGSWSSERRYLFAPAFKPVNMTTEFAITESNRGKFIVDWSGQTAGQMVLTLDGDTLHRSRDYFGDGANSSKVEVIDHDCIVLRTQYDGMRWRVAASTVLSVLSLGRIVTELRAETESFCAAH